MITDNAKLNIYAVILILFFCFIVNFGIACSINSWFNRKIEKINTENNYCKNKIDYE